MSTFDDFANTHRPVVRRPRPQQRRQRRGRAATQLPAQAAVHGRLLPARSRQGDADSLRRRHRPRHRHHGLAVLMLQDQKCKPAVDDGPHQGPRLAASTAGRRLLRRRASTAAQRQQTGLAGWALGVTGPPRLPSRPRGWLRGQQLANAGACTKYAAEDNGAVTLDASAWPTPRGDAARPVDQRRVTPGHHPGPPGPAVGPELAPARWQHAHAARPASCRPAERSRSIPAPALRATRSASPLRRHAERRADATAPRPRTGEPPAGDDHRHLTSRRRRRRRATPVVQRLDKAKLEVKAPKASQARQGRWSRSPGSREARRSRSSSTARRPRRPRTPTGKEDHARLAGQGRQAQDQGVGAFENRNGKARLTGSRR